MQILLRELVASPGSAPALPHRSFATPYPCSFLLTLSSHVHMLWPRTLLLYFLEFPHQDSFDPMSPLKVFSLTLRIKSCVLFMTLFSQGLYSVVSLPKLQLEWISLFYASIVWKKKEREQIRKTELGSEGEKREGGEKMQKVREGEGNGEEEGWGEGGGRNITKMDFTMACPQ